MLRQGDNSPLTPPVQPNKSWVVFLLCNNPSVFAGGQQCCGELPLSSTCFLFAPARCGSVEGAWRCCLAPGSPTSSGRTNPTRRIWPRTSAGTRSGWPRSGWTSSRATSTWPGTSPRRWDTQTKASKLWLLLLVPAKTCLWFWIVLVPTLNFDFSGRILFVCIYVSHTGIKYMPIHTQLHINIYM